MNFKKSNIFDNIFSRYLKEKPIFLSLIRPIEASLFYEKLPYLKPVLDFGCGDGYFTGSYLRFSHQKIDVGLDIDDERIKRAKITKRYNSLKLYDGNTIPYKSGCFSTVISNSVLEHVKNLRESLDEIYRVMKKNGYFFVSVMEKNYEKNLFGVYFLGNLYKKMMNKKANHKNLLSETEWEKEFTRSGFRVVNKFSYMGEKTTRFLDLLQYVSIPGIICSNLIPSLSRLYYHILSMFLKRKIFNLVIDDEKGKGYSAVFYTLIK